MAIVLGCRKDKLKAEKKQTKAALNEMRKEAVMGMMLPCLGHASFKISYAGDTNLTEEMKTVGEVNVALLPVGETYTMNATEAAEATKYIKPEIAIPYHWGDIVGSQSNAEQFAKIAQCDVQILMPSEIVSLE